MSEVTPTPDSADISLALDGQSQAVPDYVIRLQQAEARITELENQLARLQTETETRLRVLILGLGDAIMQAAAAPTTPPPSAESREVAAVEIVPVTSPNEVNEKTVVVMRLDDRYLTTNLVDVPKHQGGRMSSAEIAARHRDFPHVTQEALRDFLVSQNKDEPHKPALANVFYHFK